MKENICGIYKITNNLNGKFYIGKSVNIWNRWRQHRCAKDNAPIHRAMKKYGKDNFSLEILEQCSKEELDLKEKQWIAFYDGYYNINCYNATMGGDGASHPVKLSTQQVFEIIHLLKTTDIPITEIAIKYQVSTKTISDINNGKSRLSSTENYPLRLPKIAKEKKEYIPQYTQTNKEVQSYHSYKIGQYDLNSKELITIFPSAREAARIIGCNHNSILKALKSETHISYGYIWKKIDG